MGPGQQLFADANLQNEKDPDYFGALFFDCLDCLRKSFIQ